jgi:signal transduction histidine kinase
VLEVFNNGPKIPDEELPKIFDPYFSTKFEKNGTGLGLFTSKTILENKMKGTLTAENRDNGVAFTIRV